MNKILLVATFFLLVFLLPTYAEQQYDFDDGSSKTLTLKAWDALAKKDYDAVWVYTQECINRYQKQAESQQPELINDVAICFYIRGEAFMNQQKYDEAIENFNIVIDKYPNAQYWDPKGWYWKPADISKINIEKIKRLQAGEVPVDVPKKEEPVKPKIPSAPIEKLILFDEGTEEIVDYKKYGTFEGIGTAKYRYKIKDLKSLSKAVGEGIFPNSTSILKDAAYKWLTSKKLLDGIHWDYLNIEDIRRWFYKWATAPEDNGVKLFYTALALEKGGYINQAVKAYYAIVVHFPNSVGWTYWHTPWYVGRVSIDKIKFILKNNPELGMKLVDAKITIIGGFDNDIKNDTVITNPGRLIRCRPSEVKDKPINVKKLKIKKRIGKGHIQLIQYKNGHWQLFVDKKPYTIKAVAYNSTKVGQSPDKGTLEDWQQQDHNKNGRIDGPYDSWVDKNKNNIQDADEPVVGDWQLLKNMGCNTIRLYHHSSNKELLRDLYKNYGIMVLMGDFLGAYAIGSGASWYEGTDYSNPVHQKNMLESVKKMVEEFKDEPYILMWVLGNENNYGVANSAKKDPETYYKFVNEAAKLIKSIDAEHPVALCNGDTLFLDVFAKNCPDIDVYGSNSYRGEYGFGTLWSDVKEIAEKPAFITEYGCPAYHMTKSIDEAESLQADYLKGCWQDIMENTAGIGAGNGLGGVLFEWLDEWWKAYEPSMHDTKPLWPGAFPDGWLHEEWLGVCGQGDGSQSPFLRDARKLYYTYQQLWKENNRR